MIRVSFCMDRGLRNYQEDCIYVDGEIIQTDYMDCPVEKAVDKLSALFVVCDGMGGLSHGDMASRFVCEKLRMMDVPFSKEGVIDTLKKIQHDFESSGFIWSGTTVAGVYINGKKGIIFNAGDSRVYKYTPERLIYLSHDHSYVQSLVDRGVISYEEAFYHPDRHIVEFGIGDVFSQEWDLGKLPYVTEDVLLDDEVYLICSDGLSDYMTDREIHQYLYPDPFDNFKNLLNQLEKVKSDNYSIILVKS